MAQVSRRAPEQTAAGTVAVFVAVVLWGAASVMAKGARHLDGLTLGFHRLWVGAAAMTVLFLLSGHRLTLRLLRQSIPGGLAFGADIVLFFTAVKHTTVANATMISALQPVLVLLVAGSMFGEHVTASDTGWTVVALVGVGVVVFGSAATPQWSPVGDLLAVASLLAWTAYFIVGKQARRDLGALEFVTGMSIVAALVVAAVSLGARHDLSVPDAGSWGLILALALGTGGFGHFLINWAHPKAPIVLSSLLTLLIPVVAMAGAALFLDEDVVAAQVVGAVVVLGALGMVLTRWHPPPEAVEPEI